MDRSFVSVVVPHAGWGYSGKLAFRTMRRLRPDIDTVVIVGGHLRPSDSVLVAFEDEFETPLRNLPADRDLRERISAAVAHRPDRQADNTVEVQLPLLAYLYEQISVVWLRCPPSPLAETVGKAIGEYVRSTGRRVGVVGSTDLTHYGPAYGFSSHGSAREAIAFVKETNDRRIVDAMLRLDSREAVRLGLGEHSACSPGGAAAAAAYASSLGNDESVLVDYYTSYDVQPNDSFVGYAGIGFR